MNYTLGDIAKIINGQLFSNDPEITIQHISIDSRHVIFKEKTLFIALVGARRDGHQFISELIDQGVKNFLISDKIFLQLPDNINIILVENTLTALQNLAIFHRSNFHHPVIAITGSNGKTIVKEWLSQLLSEKYNVVRSPKSYNSQIGVPLSVLQAEKHHNLAIFEAGISEPDEMKYLEKILKPTFGIFTYLGDAHSSGFIDKAHKIKEKLLLFSTCKTLVYWADQILVDETIKHNFKGKIISWSFEGKGTINISRIVENEQTKLQIGSGDICFDVEIPFHDQASVVNICHVIVAALQFDIVASDIQQQIKELLPVIMRLEIKEGINNCLIIDDTYNADFDSLLIALQLLNQQSKKSKHTIILTDLLQSGTSNESLYTNVAKMLNENLPKKVITIGESSILVKSKLSPNIDFKHFRTTQSFLEHFHSSDFNNEAILIKGARDYQLERIVHALSKKSHRTVLEVNLSALLHNLNAYSNVLAKGVKIMAMVKASAYGAGSDEIASLLQYHKVDYLCVAYPDEGVELRKSKITLPIMVLNPDESTIQIVSNYNLEPEIYSISFLKSLIYQIPRGSDPICIHIKLDTGMNRLGFVEDDIELLIQMLIKNPQLIVKSIFTHLAASEDPVHDEFTHKQVSKFKRIANKITKSLRIDPILHVLNSSGIGRFPEYQLGMVRLGIGLYGFDANEKFATKLRNVHTLKATVSQIKKISKNESVGYGRKGLLDHDALIATISIGYADGFSRQLGNGNYEVIIRDQKAYTIGNVCMDMTMVEVTHIADVQEGDEVIIFGEMLPVNEMAIKMQTIPYEIFTSISNRVKRVYYQD
jgi:alanine racemase